MVINTNTCVINVRERPTSKDCQVTGYTQVAVVLTHQWGDIMSGIAHDLIMNKILLDTGVAMMDNGISEEITVVLMYRKPDGGIGVKTMLNPNMMAQLPDVLNGLATMVSNPQELGKVMASQGFAVAVGVPMQKPETSPSGDKVIEVDTSILEQKIKIALDNNLEFGRQSIIEEFVLMQIHNKGTTFWKAVSNDHKRQMVLDLMATVRHQIRTLPNDFTGDEIDIAIQNVEQAKGL